MHRARGLSLAADACTETIAAAAILISIDRRLDAKIIGARCEVTVPTLLKAVEEAEIYLKEKR